MNPTPTTRRTEFVSVGLTPAARDELRSAAVELTSPARRRLTLSEVVIAATRMARENPDAFVEALDGVAA